jgi:alpha-L-rhamnosidase
MFRQLAWAKGSCDTSRGTIVSDWKCDGKTFDWTIEVPPNSHATILVPCGSTAAHIIEGAAGVISQQRPSGGRQLIDVGSGRYRIKSAI